ncbi:hypothetical protein GCM10010345_85140 [Streptomyces canarius]|uniref:Major facilitator superfamily (MFS) profile domain-containing protein n=1 Tax=Streptomyces canarius TaxID=285453 RepID=A0ABQ3DDJ4_9ACTN|nr:hypothetical protein GCM10010345_85140 [Streptomyces canarius]
MDLHRRVGGSRSGAGRAVQGAGAGGLSALAQIVMAVMVSPASAGVTRGTWARPSPSFLYCAPLACVAFVVTLFIRENTLRAAHGPHGRAGDAERVPAVRTGAR